MATKEEIEKTGAKAFAYVCDISDEDKVFEMAADALGKTGRIDILVNNAAVFRDFCDFASSSTALWRNILI